MLLDNAMTLMRSGDVRREWVGWLFQKYALGRSPARTVRDGVTIGSYCNFSEYLAVRDFVDDDEYGFLQTHDLGAGAVIDIGANLGVVSLIVAARDPERTIYAVEPNPHTFAALRSNVGLNGAKNVICEECAIAEQSGVARFNADPLWRAMASLATADGPQSCEVAALSLDDFVSTRGIRRIALLKVDVEGYETLVFRGGGRTLNDVRPAVIYFEVCPDLATRAGFDPRDAARVLLEHGYEFRGLGAAGALSPARIEDIGLAPLENWIAVPSDPPAETSRRTP